MSRSFKYVTLKLKSVEVVIIYLYQVVTMIQDTLSNTDNDCSPKESSLKSFFLGPQSENAYWVQNTLVNIFSRWFDWRNRIHPEDGRAISDIDQQSQQFQQCKLKMTELITSLMDRFELEIPKFSPRYIGHMTSEISLPALFGHIITLLHNPNNVTGESSAVGIEFEHEAIEELLKLTGYKGGYGHFTSGGTIANFESLTRARSRMQTWLAMACVLKSKHGVQLDFFKASHMGWAQYHQYIKIYKIKHSELNEWLLFDASPVHAIKLYTHIFGEYKEPVILAPKTKHYSWEKGAKYFGFGKENLWPVELDQNGKLDIHDLEKKIKLASSTNTPILMIVSVCGTTEFGSIDPLDEIHQKLKILQRDNLHIWHHIDAAYGGLFLSLLKTPDEDTNLEHSKFLSEHTCAALRAIPESQSITIDPHKLAYVPYSSGCFLVRDPHEYQIHSENIPYLDFTEEKSRGQYTLEGSRSAAGSVATWLTAKSIGFNCYGYGSIIGRTIESRLLLQTALEDLSKSIKILPDLETNILCFIIARSGEPLSHANSKTLKTYEKFSTLQSNPTFYFSKSIIDKNISTLFFNNLVDTWDLKKDDDHIHLLRLCIMNPFFNSKESKTDYISLLVSDLKKHIQSL